MSKKCPNCNNEMPEEASFCLHCFTLISKPNLSVVEGGSNKLTKQKIGISVIAVLLICVLFTVIAFANNANDKIVNEQTSSVANAKSAEISTQSTEHTSVSEALITSDYSLQTSDTTQAQTTNTSTTITTTTPNTTTTTTVTTSKTTKATTKITTTVNTDVIFSGSTLISYPQGRKNSSYTIPYKVTKISNNAFDNDYLKTLKFSKREHIDCDWENLFSSMPNLKTVYVYPGTDADIEGLQYFDGEIVYYDWWCEKKDGWVT